MKWYFFLLALLVIEVAQIHDTHAAKGEYGNQLDKLID